MTITIKSPAKINRFLHIIGRRDDGYHLLQTLFQFLDIADSLTFELRQDDKIVLLPENSCGVPTEENLIYRAAKALQSKTDSKQGITIVLDKQLPLGGGLGGGSSNAATTLVTLNHLWECNLPQSTLMTLGLRLGADIPVFIGGHTAFGEGVGEKLTPISLPEEWAILLLPDCHVSTPKMYAHFELTRDTPAFRIGALAKAEIQRTLGSFKNDFESVVRKTYPKVDEAMKWLSNFGEARLSGSGACVFACFNTEAKAREVAEQIPPYLKGWVAKTLNQSPLYQAQSFLKKYR